MSDVGQVEWTGRHIRPLYEAREDVVGAILAERVGVADEVEQLERFLERWLEESDPEVRGMLRYQLAAPTQYLRSVTIFACNRAVGGERGREDLLPLAGAVELFQHYAIVLDDIIDKDRMRRGRLSLHARFGTLHALMACAYLAFAAGDFIAEDTYATHLFCGLGKRLAASEARQWRLRREPFGEEAWRRVVTEDTGAMFEAGARAATRDDRLAEYGASLGMLYHAADDVADVRGLLAAGAPTPRELHDRILTLPGALATEDPATAALFAAASDDDADELAGRLGDALPAAEARLDELAAATEAAARAGAQDPEPLLELGRYVRELADA